MGLWCTGIAMWRFCSHVQGEGGGGASLGECMCSLRVSLLLWSGRGVVCVFVKLPCCAC